MTFNELEPILRIVAKYRPTILLAMALLLILIILGVTKFVRR